ncbi:MAG: ABC transporter substrate-binding protein [bacterium]|nr:ABC transporter substrate-binding protein [bacterium]MDZ4285140.1 ABC transporter substrate-binding protein [Patescibacteria group bacterium]
MNWRTVSFVSALVVLLGGVGYYVLTFNTVAPTEEKMFVIGVITNPTSLDPALRGFQDGMRARGYEEGRNIRYLIEPGGGKIESAKVVAERLVAEGIDALYVMGSVAGRAAKEVTAAKNPTLPVVFGVISNPVGSKLVASIQSSGNNLTGITPNNENLSTKRLEVFLTMIPEIKRVIMAWSDPNTSGIENLRRAAQALHVELVEQQIVDADATKSFYASFPYEKGDVIFRATDAASGTIVKDLIAISLEKKIPLSGTNVSDVESGAIMSYGANYEKIGEQAARLMDAILHGTKPSELPIELPETIEFIISAKTAVLLGLTIPDAVLLQANRIIQ